MKNEVTEALDMMTSVARGLAQHAGHIVIIFTGEGAQVATSFSPAETRRLLDKLSTAEPSSMFVRGHGEA